MLPLHDDNPTQSTAGVTYALIAACVLIFLWQVSLGTDAHNRVVYALGSIPAVLFGHRELDPGLVVVPAWATVFTSMFLHGGWMHLIGNMLFLWIFGNNVEDVMGHGRFIVFYLLCGVAAAMAQALPDPQAVLPMIGASGAISGVLGAYLLLFPHARVLVGIPLGFLIYTVYMPAAFVLVLWFGLQLLNSWLAGDREGGVAFGAHIGGFLAGMLLIPVFKRRGVRLLAPPRRR
jgi:membrane associated rhomboid family serine protease